MTGKIPKSAGAIFAAVAIFAIAAATAGATTVYNNVPKPLPKNVVSEAFEATSTAEFGGQVELAGTARSNPSITAVLSSWACQEGAGKTCHTNGGATFAWPITLNVYEVGAGNEPGAKIASVTETFNIPFRPSANNKLCAPNPEGAVGYSAECFHGKVFKATFTSGVTLPSKVILSIAYNTSNYGEKPVGPAACSAFVPSRCGYDSLNVGLEEGAGASTGKQPLPNYTYMNSTFAAKYGAEPHGTIGTFSLANEWTGEQPIFEVKASK
ncbi:MAG TPA: hypothetical protein VN804_00665 [Solirubrobacteraceae bacterium]|jgi:hypothetical protein|nr:hypothetical protein [Solirubrobacteraceae bacterium]